MSAPLAHNTEYGAEGQIPLIIEFPEDFPFGPGERESEWHEASDEELDQYENYWTAQYEAGDYR